MAKKPTEKQLYKLKNEWLGQFFEEVKPKEFYRAVFPEGSFERAGHFEDGKANGIITIVENDKAKNRIVFDDLSVIDEVKGAEFAVMSPVAYSGRNRTAANARWLYGIAIDLDGVEMPQLRDVFHQMNHDIIPKCTYCINSGHGLHLYYLLEKPVPLYKHLQDTANVTHNHPEGIKGAESTASAIYMARNGSSKEEIKAYIEREFHYDLSRTLDNIRTYYHHVESCQETVPEAIIAFLESKDFEDAIRNAVSLGGDTDTLGAITGSIAEAFYGIPAVLIAECKSRIDKGLMTDVLDEFDHVLGSRSVDTYSDEVDETQANQMIEAAIDQYYIQQDKNGMLLFMEVMVTRMQQAGEVIVPYITENPFMSEEQISKVKAGDTISLDHDVRLKIETVKDADEKEWIGVFTSSEEMHKGSAGNVQMNQSIESILRLALNWEQVNGIVINPFGKYIQMTKKMIELLINGYEYNENERKSKDDENN